MVEVVDCYCLTKTTFASVVMVAAVLWALNPAAAAAAASRVNKRCHHLKILVHVVVADANALYSSAQLRVVVVVVEEVVVVVVEAVVVDAVVAPPNAR